MDFRFTLFNACTLAVMLLTVATAIWRKWPLVYYAILIGYTFGFKYSLNPFAVFTGVAIALILRLRKLEKLRWAELPVFAYVLFRGAELLLGK